MKEIFFFYTKTKEEKVRGRRKSRESTSNQRYAKDPTNREVNTIIFTNFIV